MVGGIVDVGKTRRAKSWRSLNVSLSIIVFSNLDSEPPLINSESSILGGCFPPSIVVDLCLALSVCLGVVVVSPSVVCILIRGIGLKTYTRQLGTAVTALGSGSALLDVQDTQLTTGRLDDTGPVGGGVVAGGKNVWSVLRVLCFHPSHHLATQSVGTRGGESHPLRRL